MKSDLDVEVDLFDGRVSVAVGKNLIQQVRPCALDRVGGVIANATRPVRPKDAEGHNVELLAALGAGLEAAADGTDEDVCAE
jgi:hypothetical protein